MPRRIMDTRVKCVRRSAEGFQCQGNCQRGVLDEVMRVGGAEQNDRGRARKLFTPYTERCVEQYLATAFDEPFHVQQALGANMAPLTARANAAGMASMAMASISDGAADMADDMPCCPDKSAPADCDQCPLMALCAATTLQAPLPTGIAEIQPVTLRMLLPGSDPEVDSVAYSPPPKPPRSQVLSA